MKTRKSRPLKPRNPLVAQAQLRKAGRHTKSFKALRRAQRSRPDGLHSTEGISRYSGPSAKRFACRAFAQWIAHHGVRHRHRPL